MAEIHRSGCAINLTLEALGDRWSLIVIRDIMFLNRRHFRELLTNSLEGIASNILANRLSHLVEIGLLSKVEDPSHRQKAIYSLTEPAIQLVPLFVAMGSWGMRHTAVERAYAVRSRLLEEGGPSMWTGLMDELRSLHLGHPMKGPSVIAQLTEGFERAMAEEEKASKGRGRSSARRK